KRTFELSFTVSGDDFGKILDIATKLRKEEPELKLNVSNGNSKITVSAEWMKNCPGIAAKVLDIVSKASADIMMITTSETEISILVPQADGDNTLAALEKEFVECSA
ncbi:MAG TPA: ACT domain-containing protein, partial [Clostridiales bacterium]|nr:ACT domain-containing protein [Clostridiales bacterium]